VEHFVIVSTHGQANLIGMIIAAGIVIFLASGMSDNGNRRLLLNKL
jgi:hypothetical protein